MIYGGGVWQVTSVGGKYELDGERAPDLHLVASERYTFNVSSPSLDGHPLLLSSGRDGTHSGFLSLSHIDGVTYLVRTPRHR